jgi:cold shock CspA family protein
VIEIEQRRTWPLRHSSVMVEGTVKFWNEDEGWGVLTSPAVPGELWAHFSCIVGAGYRSLRDGERVRFDPDHRPQDGYSWVPRRVVTVEEGSEFAELNDEEIDKRIKEIDLETQQRSREVQGAFRVTHRLIRVDSRERKSDPSPE